MRLLSRYIALAVCAISMEMVRAQAPSNDNCENAAQIIIPSGGYATGIFNSPTSDISEATRQKAEHCVKELEETGNCSKTVWYKFYLPTTRNVAISLTQQDSAIPQIFAGFNVYRVPDCNYSPENLSKDLPPLNKFGISGNKCLGQGWYLIQVGCKNKAKGELWVELNCSAPSSAAYDSLGGAYHFGLVKDHSSNGYFQLNCTSLEKDEDKAIGDSSFSKSIVFCVTFPQNTISNMVTTKLSGGSTSKSNFRLRIFNDTMTHDSLMSSKPFRKFDPNGILFKEECPGNTVNKKYYFHIISDQSDENISVNVHNVTYNADDWNTPNTRHVLDLDFTGSKSSQHYFNCEGLLSTHKCKNVVPPFFVRTYQQWKNASPTSFADTFKYGSYTILNVKEDGLLSVIMDDPYVTEMMLFSLYAGDIRNDCNLTHLLDTFLTDDHWRGLEYCIGKGTYTLLTGVQYFTGRVKSQKVTLSKVVTDTRFYHPLAPETVKDFNPLKDNWFSSSKVSFRNKDTAMVIDSVNVEGKLTFREIFISETADLSLHSASVNSNSSTMYIFRGRLSKGEASRIPGLDYKSPGRDFGIYKASSLWGSYNAGGCFYLEKGYYTIISVRVEYQYANYSACSPGENWVNFYPNPVCPIGNNIEPQFAFPINGNQDVLSATGNLKDNVYKFTLAYCKDCRTNSTTKPVLSCNNTNRVNESTNYYYYTFNLSENASFTGPGTYELYKGNVLGNPAITRDTTKIISPCTGGHICNLQKGEYTLVVPMNINFSTEGYIYFCRHAISANDFAANAYDLGHFASNTSKQSGYQPITCHTNALVSDPLRYTNPYYLKYRTDFVIPYKDTLNLKRPYREKNLWYTFTVSGIASIQLKALDKSGSTGAGSFEIFRYTGKYKQDFKQLLAGGFDSTNTSMEYVLGGSSSAAKFNNIDCRDNRYFVLLSRNYANELYTELALSVETKVTNLPSDGDFCENAMTGTYNSFGSYSLKTYKACHTYGGSPGETDYPNGIKSSWFKVSVRDIKTFDLEIRSLRANGLYQFNIYGGTCKGMTRITSGGNAYSYFTLSCMGSGDYYIQALSYQSYDETLEFEINIKKPVNNTCKPYDFKYPIALFKMKGGCNNDDTVRVTNQSTMGDDMVYTWYMNGQKFSQVLNPVFSRKNARLRDSNIIKLIVFNSGEFTYDTLELAYMRDTTLYSFRIKGPAISYCNDTLRLSVNTDYPEKINYKWSYPNGYALSYKPTYTQNNTSGNWYVANGESDYCEFTDTFKPNLVRSLKIYRDTALCSGQRYMIRNKGPQAMYISSASFNQVTVNTGDSFAFTSSAEFDVMYYKDQCYYTDSVKLFVEKGPNLLYGNENPYDCNVPSMELSYKGEKLLNHKWNTGDTTPKITVTNSGVYRLTGRFSKCRSLDYTYYVKLDKVNTDKLRDSMVCMYDHFPFRNPYGNNFGVVLKKPAKDTINMTKPQHLVLYVKRGSCFIMDSADISVFPFEGKRMDSLYCDTQLVFSMFLDGGNAKQYNWYLQGNDSRLLHVKDYGHYPVARIDQYGCRDTLDFTLKTNCEFAVYVPNAFSPNADLTNEFFGPVISGPYTHYSMSIYNTWGEMVFKTDKDQKWNGYFMNKPVPQGVYSFLVTVYDKAGKPYLFKGTVMVLY